MHLQPAGFKLEDWTGLCRPQSTHQAWWAGGVGARHLLGEATAPANELREANSKDRATDGSLKIAPAKPQASRRAITMSCRIQVSSSTISFLNLFLSNPSNTSLHFVPLLKFLRQKQKQQWFRQGGAVEDAQIGNEDAAGTASFGNFHNQNAYLS